MPVVVSNHKPSDDNAYKTEKYARRVLGTLVKWRDAGCKPVVIPEASCGIAPRSLRTGWYLARAFVRENRAHFTQEEYELMQSFTLKIQDDEPAGMMITRDKVRQDYADDFVPVNVGKADDTAYQLFLSFIGDENNEPGATHEVAGPFSAAEIARYREALDSLRGIYLSELTPNHIKVIYWPSGAKTT